MLQGSDLTVCYGKQCSPMEKRVELPLDSARNCDLWQKSRLDDTNSRQINTQFPDPAALESPCPWKAGLLPHLYQTGLQWGWLCGHCQVPRNAQESCWQKAGACAALAESNVLNSPENQNPHAIELIYVQVIGIKNKCINICKAFRYCSNEHQKRAREEIHICFPNKVWTVCANNSRACTGNSEENRTTEGLLIL